MLLKALRFFVGFALLPVCVAATRALAWLALSIRPASSPIPSGAWALLAGFGLWLLMFVLLPRPTRAYVLAHELTHALWGWLMGARVSGLRVRRDEGSVRVSKTNFLITLAPYFFPLYTMLVVAAYGVLSIRYDLSPWYRLWLGLVGFTWGFHVTFTVMTLMQHQTDIQSCGRLFSYSVIYLFNVLGMILWLVGVSSVSMEDMVAALSRGLQEAWVWSLQAGTALARQARAIKR